jgi:hypothetical protein
VRESGCRRSRGPSGEGLHAVDEWVDLGQVRRLTDALVDVLSAWGRRAD